MSNVSLTEEDVREMYEYCYRRAFSQSTSYRFEFKPDKLNMVHRFLSFMSKEYENPTLKNLFDYLTFQFQYWHFVKSNTDFKGLHGSISVDFVIGPKAIKRFEDRLFSNTSELCRTFKISLLDFETVYRTKPEAISDNHAIIRAAFLNTRRGRAMCYLNTSLYLPSDPSCQQCVFVKDCVAFLKVKFPDLYRRRVQTPKKNVTKKSLHA